VKLKLAASTKEQC